MTKRILIVSQEKNLARFTSVELQKSGFLVDFAENGREALGFLRERDIDLILVDLFLADMTSQEFAQKLEAIKPATILITMASCEEVETHKEDIHRYAVSSLIKPFVVADLLDQINRIFRGRDFIDQHCSQLQARTAYRDLRLDLAHHTVYRGEEQLLLTRREYDLLLTLMASPGPLTREQLLERVWKYESSMETNIVDVYIRYLRGKIDVSGQPSYIQTIRGVGYAMRD